MSKPYSIIMSDRTLPRTSENICRILSSSEYTITRAARGSYDSILRNIPLQPSQFTYPIISILPKIRSSFCENLSDLISVHKIDVLSVSDIPQTTVSTSFSRWYRQSSSLFSFSYNASRSCPRRSLILGRHVLAASRSVAN